MKRLLYVLLTGALVLCTYTVSADKIIENNTYLSAQSYYYLTEEKYQGDLVNTFPGCAPGYHMAHFMELFNSANMIYDSELGYVTEDSGQGPPTGMYVDSAGWVHSGTPASFDDYNCGKNDVPWTSNSELDRGFSVLVSYGTLSCPTGWCRWTGGFCDEPLRVWCISDPSE